MSIDEILVKLINKHEEADGQSGRTVTSQPIKEAKALLLAEVMECIGEDEPIGKRATKHRIKNAFRTEIREAIKQKFGEK